MIPQTPIKYFQEDLFYHGDNKSKNIIYGIKELVDKLNTVKVVVDNNLKIIQLTKMATNIDGLPLIKKIKNQIKSVFRDLNIKTTVYLGNKISSDFSAGRNSHFMVGLPTAKATVNNRSIFGSSNEFIVLLSEHFLNNLDEQEQVAVFAHEMAHFYWKHSSIPAKRIKKYFLQQSIIPSDDYGIKNYMVSLNLKKWNVCKEISADLFALQVTRDYRSVALSLLKFETGVVDDAVLLLNDVEHKIDHWETQSSHFRNEILKDYPEVLLRIMVIKKVSEYCSQRKWNKINNQYIQTIINRQVFKIYPEILPHKNLPDRQWVLKIGLHVAAADGEISNSEKDFLLKITFPWAMKKDIDKKVNTLNQKIQQSLKNKDYAGFKLLREKQKVSRKIMLNFFASKRCRNSIRNVENVSWIIRHLIILASEDGKITADELDVIYRFAKYFKYTKQDLVQQILNI